MSFRRAEGSDLPTVVRLVRQFHAEEGIDSNEDTVTAALSRLILDETLGLLWLIIDDNAVAGYVILTLGYSIEFHGRDAFVDELYVEPEHRGRGLGLKALEFVQQQAPQLGVRALHLEVSTKNTRAAALYRKLGFKAHDRVLMTKWLD